jgi:hypothetical protein
MSTQTIHRQASQRINVLFPSVVPLLHWPQRPKIVTTIAARRRIWNAKKASWRVVESHLLYGHDQPPRITAEFFSVINGHCGWDIVSHHRSVKAAMQSCEHAARKGAGR